MSTIQDGSVDFWLTGYTTWLNSTQDKNITVYLNEGILTLCVFGNFAFFVFSHWSVLLLFSKHYFPTFWWSCSDSKLFACYMQTQKYVLYTYVLCAPVLLNLLNSLRKKS